ncbi:VOC family protein [Rhodanobacter sp. B2A1Ga4]|uniref:VOC family protein n=1 Tax=Rhodanobacter TaxID=75309 RepID=UPI000D37ECB1|nr:MULTISPECIES: VOC family protein [Rhodanobacter]MBQ4854039.1 VOC family protein [Rhodanobacter sp. B2A1Ga4]
MHPHPVLATVAASDFAASSDWYARLFGRMPDNGSNDSCAEWQIARCTRIQVLPRSELDETSPHAGSVSLGIIVDDLDEILLGLQGRQIDVPSPQLATHYVRFAPVCDPDGNLVTFVESAAA